MKVKIIKNIVAFTVVSGLLASYLPAFAVEPPEVKTGPADFISANSAVLHSNIATPRGSGNVYVWFEIGTDERFGRTVGYQSIYTKSQNTPVAVIVDNLSPNTEYYFRGAVQSDAGGSAYGETLSFITQSAPKAVPVQPTGTVTGPVAGTETRPKGQLPGIKTEAAGLISAQSGAIYAVVDPNGTDVEVWFEWGMSANALTSQAGYIKYVNQTANGIPWAAILGNLTSNTTYYFRAVAKNSNGTVYGDVLSFKTEGLSEPTEQQVSRSFLDVITFRNRPDAPSVMTQSAGFVTGNTAVLYSLFNPNGKAVETWFEWGANKDVLGNEAGRIKFPEGQGNGTPWAAILQGLSPVTMYYYRAVLQHEGGTVYGEILSFVTAPVAVGWSGGAGVGVSTGAGGGGGGGLVPPGTREVPIGQFSPSTPSSGVPTRSVLPAIVTENAKFITTNTAVLYAVVHPNKTDVEVWFEFYGSPDRVATQVGYVKYVNQSANGIPWAAFATDLDAGKEYQFRAVAKNANGTVYGEMLSFKTESVRPAPTGGIGRAIAEFFRRIFRGGR